MKLSITLFSLSFSHVAVGGWGAASRTSPCNEEELWMDKNASKALSDFGEMSSIQYALDEVETNPLEVEIRFNIVQPKKNFQPIEHWQLQSQFERVARAFRPYGIIFKNSEAPSFTTNDLWSGGWTDKEGQGAWLAQRWLRRGNYLTLNVNIMPMVRNNWNEMTYVKCSFPRHYYRSPGEYIDDGCFLRADVLPGGDLHEHNDGSWLIHGIGHWLGLSHPWKHFSCKVEDFLGVPLAHWKIESCETEPDTCPEHPGRDPVFNFMTFAPGYCRREFTPVQMQIMRNWWMFRNRTDDTTWTPPKDSTR